MWDDVLSRIDCNVTPQKAIALWGGDINTLGLVSSGVNLVYRFLHENQVCYLRLTHSKLRSLLELEAALSFQMHLQLEGVPVCRLISSSNDCLIERIEQDNEMCLAHVVLGVSGEPMHFNYHKQIYEQWGKQLGEFHLASQSYRTNKHEYGRWEDDVTELEGYAKTESKIVQKELNEAFNCLQSYPQIKHNYGLIHGDHRKGNVLTDVNNIHFIDFDLPRFCWFMDDISRPFFSSIMKGDQNWQDKLEPYIKGYRAVCKLTTEDLTTFPCFIRYKALNMYLWTKYNWTGDIAPGGVKTKEWLTLLYNMIINQDWKDQLISLVTILR